MSKAICEMNNEELASEYLYCVVASQDTALDVDNRAYFRDRAEVVKKYMNEQEHLV